MTSAEDQDHLGRNRTKAAEFFTRAADLGSPEGHYNLAVILMPTDANASFHHFTIAAETGFAAAQNGLGSMYLHGREPMVAKNVTKAYELFNAAAEAGSADGRFNVATMYRFGFGVAQNIPRAVEYMSIAALSQNHVNSQYHLGQAFFDRTSWIQKYYEKTKAFGAKVTIELHDIDRYDRITIKHSCGHAQTMLKAAAERGLWGKILSDALEKYWNEDYEGAINLYTQAAEMGYDIAQDNSAYLYELLNSRRNVSAKDRHYGYRHAMRLHRILTQKDHFSSARVLGDYMYYGLGQEAANHSQALAYYDQASSNGDEQSLHSLATLYYYGYSYNSTTFQNITGAIQLLEEGIESQTINFWAGTLTVYVWKVQLYMEDIRLPYGSAALKLVGVIMMSAVLLQILKHLRAYRLC